MTVFGDRTFTEVTKVKGGHTCGTQVQQDGCPPKKKKSHQGSLSQRVHTGTASEDAATTWPSKAKERSHQKAALLDLDLGTSRLQNREKIHF